MKTNVAASSVPVKTHEGGVGERHTTDEALLERSVATCMLFENTFYESGEGIADRIRALAEKIGAKAPEKVAALAVKARTDFKLRHVPLWLVRSLARAAKGRVVGDAIAAVVQRPDEMAELLAMYWRGQDKERRESLSKQVKAGLARAFTKFSEYQLSKWDRDGEVKLRDVLFLVHAKPKDAEQAATWKRLVDRKLSPPDTWEVALSAGKDKRATWERLVTERKLGYMALLMNLRNMDEAGVDRAVVERALAEGALKSRALPFRFVSAAEAAPSYAQALSDAMVSAVSGPRLPGTTYVVVDVSGSMDAALSGRSAMNRVRAAGAVAALARELCESARTFTFSNALGEVPNLRGLALVNAVFNTPRGGTNLQGSLQTLFQRYPRPDRVVVFTDEQAHDGIEHTPSGTRGYVVNVAPYAVGVEASANGWCRINGFSERIVDWIRYEETGSAGAEEEQ